MENIKIKQIDLKEKDRLIQSGKFSLHHNMWHYSFNDNFERRCYCISDKNGRINIASNPVDSWSPVMMYTNYDGPPLVMTNNLILDEYNKADVDIPKVFWYLSLTGFDDFLKRRDAMSANPKKSFPSSKTYYDKSAKINYTFIYEKFNRELFIKHFDDLKHPERQSGEVVLGHLTTGSNRVPKEWLRVAYLVHENEVVTMAIMVDDSRSICLFNLATRRSSLGYGNIFCTEMIKYGCEHQYYSVDSGVSGKYGIYKDKVFLDSRYVFEGQDIFEDSYQCSPSRKYIRNVYHVFKNIYAQFRTMWINNA